MNPPPSRDPRSSASRLRSPSSSSSVRSRAAAPAPRPPAAPAGKGKLAAALFAGVAAALAVVAAVVHFTRPDPAKAPEVADVVLPKPAPAAPMKPVEAPKPAESPKQAAPPNPPQPPPPPRKAEPLPGADEQFRERLAKSRKEALEKVEEARREVAEERKAAAEAASALRARLARRTITIKFKDGEMLKGAVVTAFTMQNADLKLDGGSPRTILWDSVDPSSLPGIVDALFEASAAAQQFDRGRFFIARRMWKEAVEGFERAAKLGEGYETRFLEFKDALVRLATGQGAFRGSARKVGPEHLLLTYDFREAAQLEDWTKGLALAGTAAVLESKEPAAVALRGGTEPGGAEAPVLFVGELGLEARVTCGGPVTFNLFVGPKGGYELELGPAGAVLYALNPDAAPKERRREIARSDKAKLEANKPHDLRLRAKQWSFSVSVDKQESVSLKDTPSSPQQEPPKGLFGMSIPGGKLRLDGPLILQGRLPRSELETRLGDTEVLVRRALEPELEEIRERQMHRLAMQALGESKAMALTADDPHFLDRISQKKYADYSEGYEKCKRELAAYVEGSMPHDFNLEEWEKRISALITKYPDVPGLYYLRALYHSERQSGVLAKADLAKAVEIFPEFAEAHLQQGEESLEELDAEGGLAAANRVIDAKPDASAAYVLRARATFAKSPLARESYEEDLAIARKLDPNDSQAIYFQRVLLRQLRGPRELGCRFEHATEHYLVTSDISAEASKRYGESLEVVWSFYVDSFKDASRNPYLRKPRVAVFQTAENYYTYFELLSESRGEETLGVFRPQFNEFVLFDTADRAETMQVLFHEQFHQFMHLMTSETPPFWYNEGMAEYMSAVTIENGKVAKKAQVLQGRFTLVRLMVEVDHVIPFEKIMCESPREFYGPEAGLNYAQSWAMIHFFYQYSGGKYRPLIERYFRELCARKTPRQAYEAVFKEKVADCEKEWREYVKTLKP